MTTMTLAPADGDFHANPRSIGRADAYDDATTMTLDELVVRASAYVDFHPVIDYARGYIDRILELRLELDAVSGAEAELAYTSQS